MSGPEDEARVEALEDELRDAFDELEPDRQDAALAWIRDDDEEAR